MPLYKIMLDYVWLLKHDSYFLKNISFSNFHFVACKEPEACFSLLFTIFQVQPINSNVFFPNQITTFESYFDCTYDTNIFKWLKMESRLKLGICEPEPIGICEPGPLDGVGHGLSAVTLTSKGKRKTSPSCGSISSSLSFISELLPNSPFNFTKTSTWILRSDWRMDNRLEYEWRQNGLTLPVRKTRLLCFCWGHV